MARIKVIKKAEASGRLREIYDEISQKRGKIAEVHAIQSLRPESIVKHIDLYLEIMYSKSELSRAEREMMAVVVSVYNQCEYCQIHHAEALQNYWKKREKVELLRKNYQQVDLSERESALCYYSHVLTIKPKETNEKDMTEMLRKVGLTDNGILDATLVIAYFNFVNRIVLSLDVKLETDSGKGYKYS
jgi:uncharacterized peroxidase-related enzyme